jgi:peptidoglycan/xylan/chitin deacetylase (PgdA/CDA1 family)
MMDNQSGGVILLYHRVTTLATDPQLLAVTPAHFAAQMEVLRRIARPMALGEMFDAARCGHDLRGAVAITFDDGYADNLLEARSILQSAKIPATVFAATAGADCAREFFWDELDRIFLQPGRLPRRLSISVGDSAYEADLAEAADYSVDQWRDFGGWNVTNPENPTARQRMYRDLCGLIHRATVQQRRRAIREIQQWSGLGQEGRATHRMMNAAQWLELAAGGLIDIGGHTVHHPLLAAEDTQTQCREISDGKAAIETGLGWETRSFSYPFGGHRDYTSETAAAVKAAGFEYACSNFVGVVNGQTDPFQLPRVIVRDWNGAEFLDRLTQWQTGAKLAA